MLVLRDVTLIDGTGAEPVSRSTITIQAGRIRSIGLVGSGKGRANAIEPDVAGMSILPGLTDAHVHLGWTGIHSLARDGEFESSPLAYALAVKENLELALSEGFTTVRDAGGLDPAFARAVDAGHLLGPEILPSGSFISQTGGHGDLASPYARQGIRSIPGLLALPEVVDGVDAVRAAARRQLRLGASQLKVMAGGGVISPTDELDSLQFSPQELEAANGEAAAAGKYVMAHCHTSESIHHALDAGIRCIEHGSLLDEQAANRMASERAYLVSTLLTSEVNSRKAQERHLTERQMMKLERIRSQAYDALRLAIEVGVLVGSGSDLIGPRQIGRGEEIPLKAEVIGFLAAVRAATLENARLFGLDRIIGSLEVGKRADLIVVSGSAHDDPRLLADAKNIPLVIKKGAIVKNTL